MDTRLLVCATLALTVSCAQGPDAGPSRHFDFTYSVQVPAPAGAQTLELWVPVVSDDPGVQEVNVRRWSCSHGEAALRREPSLGNRMLHVRLEKPTGVVRVEWVARVRRQTDAGQGRLPSHERFTSAARLIPIDGTARELADKLGVRDASLPARERAKRIFDDTLGEMAYDKAHEGWGLGSFEHATTVCKGNCTDFHSRFLGVGRAAGLAVRFTMGIPLAPGKSSYDSYHCWAHFRDGGRWVPVDISEADKVVDVDPARAERFFGELDPDRLTISVGRDVPLAPPAAQGPRNYFVFPYAEVDGRELPLAKGENWSFRWTDL